MHTIPASAPPSISQVHSVFQLHLSLDADYKDLPQSSGISGGALASMFLDWLQRRFFLDPEGKMSIGEKQFARACVEIGFKGNT
eukprot:2675218-Amphidinium_carterae.1